MRKKPLTPILLATSVGLVALTSLRPAMAAQGQGDQEKVPGSVRSPIAAKAAEKVLAQMARARTVWKEGHRREAVTLMLVAHRDCNALNAAPEDPPSFDPGSGLTLAAMYDELGDLDEAYEYYHRVIRGEGTTFTSTQARQADVLLRYSEVCTSLGRKEEAKWAFGLIAEGDPLTVYVWAAQEALTWTRLELAERWATKALQIEPENADAKECLRRLHKAKAKGIRSDVW